MAWTDDIDPRIPTDLSLTKEGDDRIRELKRALNERLATIFTGWPDTDPLTWNEDTFADLQVGTLAARPAATEATFYYATDTDQLFVSLGAGWSEYVKNDVEVGTGLPAAHPVRDMAFYDTDDEIIYFGKEGWGFWFDHDLSLAVPSLFADEFAGQTVTMPFDGTLAAETSEYIVPTQLLSTRMGSEQDDHFLREIRASIALEGNTLTDWAVGLNSYLPSSNNPQLRIAQVYTQPNTFLGDPWVNIFVRLRIENTALTSVNYEGEVIARFGSND